MRYADINSKFSDIVGTYLSKGYRFNTATMSGSQGEIAKADLTDGNEIIRVVIASFSHWEDFSADGIEIEVGRASGNINPDALSRHDTIWNHELEILRSERFYKLGEDRKHGVFFGDYDTAKAVAALRIERYLAKRSDKADKEIDNIEIAKRLVRRKFGIKRIIEKDIKLVRRSSGKYVIFYRNRCEILK